MKFNFSRVPTLLLGALACAACARAPRSLPPPPDGGDAQRLVALLDYVGGDYGRAVRDGRVESPAEYDEQRRFVADARAMAEELLQGEDDPLLARLAELQSGVASKAGPDEVRTASRAAREAVVARFGLRTSPSRRPSLQRGAALYGASCVVCHGARGDAATERAQQLDPPPASFLDPERRAQLSPYRVYNALTFGVAGTGMASFDTLTPEERWDLSFYVMRLAHEGRGPLLVSTPLRPGRQSGDMSLHDLAARSDQELQAALARAGHPDPAAGLAHLRRELAYLEPPLDAALRGARERVAAARDAFAAGRAREADRLAIDAYLQGFEPLEPRLRARDAGATVEIERAFGELRRAIAAGDRGGLRAASARLDRLLSAAAGEREARAVPFVAAALIYLREGIEAALLVGALLAGVRKLGRAEAARYVHAGWIAALPAGVLTWWLFEGVLELQAARRELLEAVVALLAALVLFSVSFWMISKVESRRWIAYLQRGIESSVSRRNLLLLSGLAFLAVYREAAETVLFTQALLLDAESARGQVFCGAAVGLALVAALALALSRSARHLPLGPFFAVSGLLLCALAISFAGAGMHALVATGYLSPRPVAWPGLPWMGIHPDLAGLSVQLAILALVAAAGLTTLRRQPS